MAFVTFSGKKKERSLFIKYWSDHLKETLSLLHFVVSWIPAILLHDYSMWPIAHTDLQLYEIESESENICGCYITILIRHMCLSVYLRFPMLKACDFTHSVILSVQCSSPDSVCFLCLCSITGI